MFVGFFFGETLEAVFPAILEKRMILKIWCDRPDKKCNKLIKNYLIDVLD